MRRKAERRRNDFLKARRKQKICQEIYGFEWYKYLHMYSKNKIHCSCPICSAKTKTRNLRLRDRRELDRLEYSLKDG